MLRDRSWQGCAERRHARRPSPLNEYEKNQGEKKVVALNKIMEQNNLGITYDDVCDKPDWYREYQGKDFYHDIYWTVCDIRDKESAINDNLRKLKDAQQVVQNWKEKLRLEEVKLQYIQDGDT